MGQRMDGWQSRAACTGFPPEWWFPERAGPERDEEVRAFAAAGITVPRIDPTASARARAICAQCPVAAECIMSAVVSNEESGVWGVGGQRRRYLRKQYTSLGRHEFAQVVLQEVKLIRNGYTRDEVQPLRRCQRCERQGLVSWLHEGVFPEDVNGPDARCGKAVTYARGCRCWHCRLAHSMRISHRKNPMARRATG